MATIENREGAWRVKIRKRGIAESKTFRTRYQAKAWAMAKELEADQARSGALPKKTLQQALERYWESISTQKRGARWERIRFTSWCNQDSPGYIPFVGSIISEVTPKDVSEHRDRMLARVAPGTVIRELGLLSGVFEVARKEWGWVKDNPVKAVRRPRAPEHRKRRASEDEIDRICAAAGWSEAAVSTKTQEVCAAFLLAIETAMRQGEILGITTKDINRQARTVTLPMTKNGTSRVVPLSARALQLLDLVTRGDGALFSIKSSVCDTLFRRICRVAGVEGLRFHDSRREATSRLSKKVDVLTLAKITGHKNLKMLLTYYEADMRDVAKLL